MEDAFLDSDPVRKHVLQKLEFIFTALFTLEMLLKWIGIGLTDYFTSVWCLLDCVIVAVMKERCDFCIISLFKIAFSAVEIDVKSDHV